MKLNTFSHLDEKDIKRNQYWQVVKCVSERVVSL